MFQHFHQLLMRSPSQSMQEINSLKITNLSSIFHEGLYISSPELWAEFQKENQTTDKEKLRQSVLKYWIRSCTRSTPYGTFAGSTIASVAETTNIVLNNSICHNRFIRIDNNHLSVVVKELLRIQAAKDQIRFYPNDSIYKVNDNYRYAQCTLQNNTRNYHLNAISRTNHIDAILETVSNGATLEVLTKRLMEVSELSYDEAATFLNEIIDAQLLISEIESNVTGTEPLDNLIMQLEHLHGIEEIQNMLKAIQELIQNPKEGVAYYKNIEEQLKNLNLNIEVRKNTLQTDMFLSAKELNVQKELVENIIRQASELTVFSRKKENADLENFRNKFYEKYVDAELPLFLALDTDIGIGYAGMHNESTGGGDLVDNLFVVGGQTENDRFDHIRRYALRQYNDYAKDKKPQIEIKEEDIKQFREQGEANVFPNSMFLIGSLFKKDDIINPEKFTFNLISFSGPSGANLLGRFTHGDEKLAEFTKEILAEEEKESPDAIYAEIVHLPEARIGNVLLRPVLRKYEIPYLGKSGADKDFQIPINDLMVSIQNNEVVLRSKKHNKRVIPRLTTAHNYSNNSLPIYKFLCDLQHQGYYHPVLWDWGNLASLKHLPRVVYKNLIIKRGQWKIEENDIKDLPKNKDEYVAYFEQFREKHELPQRIVYVEGDNELMIDFGYVEHIDLFLHYLRKYKNILLEEFLFTEENCVVTDVNGDPFTNEMIIPIYQEAKPTTAQSIRIISDHNVKRKFTPNSEWIYFKVYCGAKQAEKVMKELVLPFVEKGQRTKLFEQFFFIRYKDDFPHLRIRFYNADADKNIAVQKEFLSLLQPLVDAGLIDKILLDTYSRELERYGPDLIEESESLFYYDSLAVLRLLNLPEIEEQRLFFALRGIDALLDDFKFDLTAKRDLLKIMQASYFKEHGARPELQKQLNEKYRNSQKDIFSYFNPKNDIKSNFFNAAQVFKSRSKQNSTVVESISRKIEGEGSNSKLFELLPSYIHMFMNRLYIAQQRKYELVVYHFLEKYYTSQLAIKKKGE